MTLAQYVEEQLLLATAFEAIGHYDDAADHLGKALVAEFLIDGCLPPETPIVAIKAIVITSDGSIDPREF